MNAGAVAVDVMESNCIENTIAWLGAAVLLFGAVFWADRSSPEMTDFSVTYVGARIVYEGRGAKLYDLSEQQRTKSALLNRVQPLIFEHPPFEALILSPLGALSYRAAYLVWGFFNALIWLFLPHLLRPYLALPRSTIAYFSLWLLFAPLGITLYQGQSSLLVLLFVSLSFIALKHNKDVLSGIWLGMALLKFQFAIPFALVFLLRRKWAMMTGFATSAAVLTALCFAAVGWHGIVSYLDLLLTVAGHPHNLSYGAARDMATLQAFFDVVFGAILSSAVIHILAAVIAAALVFYVAQCWGREEAKGHSSFDLFFAAAIVIALIASAHMFTHDMSPLVLASLLIAAHIPRQKRLGLRMVLSGAVVVLWIPPLYFVLVAWHCIYLFLLVLLAFAAAVLIAAKAPQNCMQARPALHHAIGL